MGTFVPNPDAQGRARRVAWDDQEGATPLTRGELEEAFAQEGVKPRRRAKLDDGLADCLIYPLRDGPGVALLVAFPPFLWVMSVPVFDLIAALQPQGEFNALAMLILP